MVTRQAEMMRIDHKQLNDAATSAPTDRQTAALDKARDLSRRSQALLAAAGESEPSRRWYVLRVMTGHEKDVDIVLGRADVERWLPVESVVPKRRGGMSAKPREAVEVPFWPGYLFVKVAGTDRAMAGLLGVEHVLGILGGALRPAALKDDIILKLQLFLQKDRTARETLLNALKVGHAVRVDSGPFASFEGVVTLLQGFDRVKVEVNIFGRVAPVALHLDQVSRIG